jgi:PleD family two-component response regulator
VTVSIGVAVTRGVAGPQGPDELLASADRALYRAKDAGRNLVAV